MAHSFKTTSGSKAFGGFNKQIDAGEYIHKKKAKVACCFLNKCNTNVKVGSQSNKLSLEQSTRLCVRPCVNYIDKTDLYINLITTFDLKDVPVILDVSGSVCPTSINQETLPYVQYNIDPSGNLFGNTVCGLNNFVNYMVYTSPESSGGQGYINNL
jgi:hypothetical protein